MTRLTLPLLRAMEAALSAMLAGEEGEGDWPEGMSGDDVEQAHNWVCEQINKRERK